MDDNAQGIKDQEELQERIKTLETQKLTITNLLVKTFDLLQRREKEIQELKSKISALESDDVLTSLKNKLALVQRFNFSLQKQVSLSSHMGHQLEEAKLEISRLNSLLTVPSTRKREKPPNDNSMKMPTAPFLSSEFFPSPILSSKSDLETDLLISDNEFSLFSEAMADVLGPI